MAALSRVVMATTAATKASFTALGLAGGFAVSALAPPLERHGHWMVHATSPTVGYGTVDVANALLAALGRVSVRSFVAASGDRALQTAFDRLVHLWGAEHGFMGAHRLKIAGEPRPRLPVRNASVRTSRI